MSKRMLVLLMIVIASILAVPAIALAGSKPIYSKDGTMVLTGSHNYVTISGNTTKWQNTNMKFKYTGNHDGAQIYIRLWGSGSVVWDYDNLNSPNPTVIRMGITYTKTTNVKTYRNKTFSDWQLWGDGYLYCSDITGIF